MAVNDCSGSGLMTEESANNEENLEDDELQEMRDKYLFLTESDFDDWWSKIDSRRVEKKSFTDHEDDIFKYSVILKSFRNEYETDSLFSTKSAKLIKEGKFDFSKNQLTRSVQKTSIELLVPGYNPNSFIPNTSTLTYQEVQKCREIIEAGGPTNQEQANFWAICKVKLEEEQKEYMELAKEHWLAENIKRHSEIRPQVKELVDLFWKARLERVYTYPKFYAVKEDIALTQSGSQDEVEVKFIKKLETVGRPARYLIPDLWVYMANVNKVIDSIEKPTVGWSKFKENSCYKSIHQTLIDKGYHSDVSKDSIAERLAKENGANIVMSSSGFACLLDPCNIENKENWYLPFSVIEYQADRGTKRVVLIDKKLPPNAMTTISRNKYYAKLAVKRLFTQPSTDYRDPNAEVYDDPLATFGVDSPKKSTLVSGLCKKKKKKCSFCLKMENVDKTANDSAKCLSSSIEEDTSRTDDISDSDESSRFYIDIDDEDAETKKSPVIKSAEEKEKPKVTRNQQSKAEADDFVCRCTYEWVEDKENPSDGVKNKKLKYQVTYNLWEFNSSASQNYMSKHCSKNLKVIIRTTMEGQAKEKNEHFEPVQTLYKLSPKLEYQTEFGAEAVTSAEILKEWASVFIRPSAKLARVRLDGVSGELIQVQKLSAPDLATESQRLYKINPKDRLACFHSILVNLSDLPAGQYMLIYKQTLGNFVEVAKSVERGGNQVTNMHLNYNNVDPSVLAPQRSPFPPLDPTVITPTCQQFKRIPCTFAPKFYQGRKSLLQDNSVVNPPASTLSKRKGCKRKKKKK